MNSLLANIKSIPWGLVLIYAAVILAALGIIILILLMFLIFYLTIYRNPRKKRTRECTNKKDELQMHMFNEGASWAEKYKDKIEDLQIVSDGLNLFGQYINLGFDKCCIILQGRIGSLLQCYYFADVYAKNGYNIFVFDFRSQGLSDGKYQTGGIKESDDLVLWIKFLNEKYNITDFTLHGICIGAATAVYAYSKLKKEGNGLVKRIVTDGLYKTYFELYKGHAKAYSRSSFHLYLYVFFLLIFIITKTRPFKETPIKYIKDIDIPILFICSVMDKFCSKSNSEQLFNECASLNKEICFFPKGRHAHIRNAQSAEYDALIAKFLQKYA